MPVPQWLATTPEFSEISAQPFLFQQRLRLLQSNSGKAQYGAVTDFQRVDSFSHSRNSIRDAAIDSRFPPSRHIPIIGPHVAHAGTHSALN